VRGLAGQGDLSYGTTGRKGPVEGKLYNMRLKEKPGRYLSSACQAAFANRNKAD